VSLFSPDIALPEPLPAGETILWRGQPRWLALALRAFHVHQVAIYFGLIALWRLTSGVVGGERALSITIALLWLLVPFVAACGVLLLLAWLSSRTTQFTITSRRMIMQFGVALPRTLSIPFRIVVAASLRSYADGTGDIPFATTGDARIAYLTLWPYVRPWRVARAEPMMRAIPYARLVSEILGRAVIAAANTTDGFAPVVAGQAIAGNATATGAAVPTQVAVAAA
jgi:hypothetical protein